MRSSGKGGWPYGKRLSILVLYNVERPRKLTCIWTGSILNRTSFHHLLLLDLCIRTARNIEFLSNCFEEEKAFGKVWMGEGEDEKYLYFLTRRSPHIPAEHAYFRAVRPTQHPSHESIFSSFGFCSFTCVDSHSYWASSHSPLTWMYTTEIFEKRGQGLGSRKKHIVIFLRGFSTSTARRRLVIYLFRRALRPSSPPPQDITVNTRHAQPRCMSNALCYCGSHRVIYNAKAQTMQIFMHHPNASPLYP